LLPAIARILLVDGDWQANALKTRVYLAVDVGLRRPGYREYAGLEVNHINPRGGWSITVSILSA
jgi:hypothetical protein